MHAGRYGCRVQTAADTVSDETELLVRGEYTHGATWKHYCTREFKYVGFRDICAMFHHKLTCRLGKEK